MKIGEVFEKERERETERQRSTSASAGRWAQQTTVNDSEQFVIRKLIKSNYGEGKELRNGIGQGEKDWCFDS